MLRRMLLLTGVVVSALMIWFAIGTYQSARPIAEENLRGLALSLAAALERIAADDPSFHALAHFNTNDLAYFALIDRNGVYRSHSNEDLVGTRLRGAEAGDPFGPPSERRVTLGTGESAYLFDRPVTLGGERYLLRITLHTFRADAVVRRAKVTMALTLSLLAAGWVLAVVLYRYARREQALQVAVARQENLAKLGEMGATLAHEIRNPLAGIKGFAQMLAKRPEDPRNGAFAQRIVAEAVRLENLVEDLLLYAGPSTCHVERVALAEVLEHTASLVREQAARSAVELDLVCPQDLEVTGNRDRIGQVFLNLAHNALQAMQEGGRLLMQGRALGGVVAVLVSDTGCGIPEPDQGRIFEPFFTTGARGTGLGLPLCKKIVEEHGGTLAVESAVGAGTTVTVTLPRWQHCNEVIGWHQET